MKARFYCLAAVAVFFSWPALPAANRLFINNQVLQANASGQPVIVYCDNDVPIYGVQLAMKFDRTKINIASVEVTGYAAAAKYPIGTIDNNLGEVVYGFLMDFKDTVPIPPDPPYPFDITIPAGTNRAILKLTIDVKATTNTSTTLDLADGAGTPPLNNVFSDDQGSTVRPALGDGSIIIDTFAPTIATKIPISPSGLAGAKFKVVGKNYDKAGLSVKLCAVAETTFTVLDAQTIEVTAPACGATGLAALEICNNFGCATDNNGFNYLESPKPKITNASNNTGKAGKAFFVAGDNFDEPNLTVKVCNADADFTVLTSTSLQVTAPVCGTLGWAVLEVCNLHGCATRGQGFNYLEVQQGTPFIRGDANNDGSVDVSDGIVILEDQFLGKAAAAPCRDALDANDSGDIDISDPIYLLTALFIGGDPIKPPYPQPGLDPTPEDKLPSC
ncbi:MAG: IPT/TIG domain-containing protein [Planctomycetes bacterium]|nr:IPT/TIG domain-containing protein [Planctomycetota bacterium]